MFNEELLEYGKFLLDLKKYGIKCDKELTDVLGKLHEAHGFASVNKNASMPNLDKIQLDAKGFTADVTPMIGGIDLANKDYTTGYIPPEALFNHDSEGLNFIKKPNWEGIESDPLPTKPKWKGIEKNESTES